MSCVTQKLSSTAFLPDAALSVCRSFFDPAMDDTLRVPTFHQPSFFGALNRVTRTLG